MRTRDISTSIFSCRILPPLVSARTRPRARVEDILAKMPGVQYTTSVIGFSLLSYIQTSYNAFFFVDFEALVGLARTRAEQFQAIKQRLNQELSRLPQGTAFSFSPPAIPGVGTSGGFTFVLEDRGGNDISYLAANVDKFLAAARKRPEIAGINTSLLPSVPQQFVDVDRDKALKQGVAIADVYTTLQAFMGGVFVNYFNRFGRQWQVYVQADERLSNHRAGHRAVLCSQQHRRHGSAVGFDDNRAAYRALSTSCTTTSIRQPRSTAAPHLATARIRPWPLSKQVFAQTMPRDMGYDYMGMSFQQKLAEQGVSSTTIFGISLLFVFLILAALYESWSLPFSVLLSTPVAVFGAFGVLLLRRLFLQAFYPAYMVDMENDVYSQIGLVMLIGLARRTRF